MPHSPAPTLALLGVLAACAVSPLAAQERTADAAVVHHPGAASAALPLPLSKTLAIPPRALLDKAELAAPDRIEAIGRWNAERGRPVKAGFGRPLGDADLVTISPDAPAGGAGAIVEKTAGGVVWASRIEVRGAYRLRLRLTEVELPAGTRLWVSGDGGDATGFGAELLRQEGDLWTPSVAGGSIHLQVSLPPGSRSSGSPARFRIDSVAQIFRLDSEGAVVLDPSIRPKGTECLLDAACFDDSDLDDLGLYKEAVAHLQYMVGNDPFICSGALMNDTDTSGFIPYLLTANHCFDTQASASTLESFFDFIAPTCLGTWPDLGSLPRVVGATLLATTANTDATFVQLSGNPSGPTGYLGWSTAPVAAGTDLFRLSHPFGWAQSFSTSEAVAPAIACEGRPASQYIYSSPVLGGAAPGSSGSPLVDDDLRVRGQLSGACGPDPQDPCNPLNDHVDGRFSSFFASIQEYLDPIEGGTCVEDLANGVVCLQSGRFRLETTYFRLGVTERYILDKLNDEVVLGFYNHQPTNLVTMQKVRDNCGPAGVFTFWWGGITLYESTVDLTDLQNGTRKIYTSPAGGVPLSIRDATWSCD